MGNKRNRNYQLKEDTSVTNQTTEQQTAQTTAQEGDQAQDVEQTTEQAVQDTATNQESTQAADTSSQEVKSGPDEAGPDNVKGEEEKPIAEQVLQPALQANDTVGEKSDFDIYLDKIRATDSDVLKTILVTLEEYKDVMGANTVTSERTVNQHQGALWRAIRMAFNSAEDFEAAINLLIQFIREHSDAAFQHHLLFRGFEHTTLNAEHSKAFQNALALLTAAAGTKNRANVRKNIDLARMMESQVFTDAARSRVIGYFS